MSFNTPVLRRQTFSRRRLRGLVQRNRLRHPEVVREPVPAHLRCGVGPERGQLLHELPGLAEAVRRAGLPRGEERRASRGVLAAKGPGPERAHL